jgi:hypothetical protein
MVELADPELENIGKFVARRVPVAGTVELVVAP